MELDKCKADYVNLTSQLGEKTYMVKVLETEINNLIKQIYECNVRANEIQSKKDAPRAEEPQG